MSQEIKKPTLTDLINDWMRGDPLLCQHFRWEVTPDNPTVFVGAHCLPNQFGYAVGYFSGNILPKVATWTWQHEKSRYPSNRQQNKYYTPEDPQFFEKFKAGLILGHNSISKHTQCSI